MTKKDIVRKRVRQEVYPLMQAAWPTMKFHMCPHSDAQDLFLNELSKWVYEEFGQYFSKAELDNERRAL